MGKGFSDGRERRIYARIETALTIQFRFPGEVPDRVFSGVTRNISHGGVCVEISEHVTELMAKAGQENARVLVHLALSPADGTVTLEGTPSWGSSRIDWVQKPSRQNAFLILGIAFEDLSDETRAQIHNFIVNEFVKNYGKNP